METKIKPCRYCGDAWIYYFGEDVPIDNYKNLGWRINCKCGLAGVSSIWLHNKEVTIKNWNSCIFALDNDKIL